MRAESIALVLTCSIATAAMATTASAQSPSSQAATADRDVPILLVGGGAGLAGNQRIFSTGGFLQNASLQWLLDRHLAVEGDVTRWNQTEHFVSAGHQVRSQPGGGVLGYTGDFHASGSTSGWSSTVNLLYRTEPRRITVFGGGGLSYLVEERRNRSAYVGCIAPGFERFCPPSAEFVDDRGGFAAQGVAGVEVRVAGPLRGYAQLQIAPMSRLPVRVMSGVRVAAISRPLADEARRRAAKVAGAAHVAPAAEAKVGDAAPAASAASFARDSLARASIDKQVRITLASGDRINGRLMSLTDTDVTILAFSLERRTYPLDEVLEVETVHHGALNGALLGFGIGFLGGYAASCGNGDEGDCWPEIGAIVGGVGAAVGAAIGGAMDRGNAPDHVIYAAPQATRALTVSPVLTRHAAGLNVRLGW
jgi:hypothetical protein